MRKLTLTLLRYVCTLSIVILSCTISQELSAQCDSGTLSGSVFEDYNADGNNVGEPGLGNVLVSIFDFENNLISQTITSGNGDFSFTGLVDGDEYRIEFDYASDYNVTFQGGNSGTEIQFGEVPFCDVTLGLSLAPELCDNDPDIFLTCFANEIGGAGADASTIVGVNYGFTSGSSVRVLADKNETGSIWGLAYDKTASTLYSAAFVKQHAALTNDGHDAIFVTNNVSGSASTSLFTTLSSLGQPSGVLTTTDVLDCEYSKQVGKIGLGGLVLSPDKQYLYVANLFNNTVVKIDVANPTAATTQSFNVPTSCADERIFALEMYNGKLYIGATCTAESTQSSLNSEALVYEMNLASNTINLVFRTNEIKGYWQNDPASFQTGQWLTDLGFSDEGFMILGLSDRLGHTYCNLSNDSRLDQQFGDILVAWNNNGTWTLESNGSAGAYSGSGVGNGQGPGGGEFFGDDYWITNPNYHPEVNLGSFYIHPNTGQIVTAVFDPITDSYSGGLHRYRTDNGDKVSAIQLYRRDPLTNFGKASGFGNIIGACDPAEIEIGNFVWEDDNGNGVQDGAEAPLEDVTVLIYDESCNVIGQTQTDEKGNYYFNNSNVDVDGDGVFDGLSKDACYYITLDYSNYDDIAKLYSFGDDFYIITQNVAGSRTNSDYVEVEDVCPLLDGKHAIKVTTTDIVSTDYTFDIGLKLPEIFDLALKKILVGNLYKRLGDTATFEISIYNQGEVIAEEVTITDYIPDGLIFDPSLNPDWVHDPSTSSAKTKYENLLFPNNSTNVYINLIVSTARAFEDYVNRAEISGAIDYFGDPGQDIDSVPDDDNTNDNGGVVTSITDDLLTGNGTDDEDDEDPARVLILDLALRKLVVGSDIVKAGDEVTFDIIVFNQGFVDVEEFYIADYLNPNFEFVAASNPGWVNNSGILEYHHTSTLAFGDNISIPITLKVNDDYTEGPLYNYAEVSTFGINDPAGMNIDFDSTPDSDESNDQGANPDDITDNLISDHNEIDEDDHDVAIVFTSYFDLALTKSSEQKIFEVGDIVEFDINITNQGSIPANNIRVVDYLPSGTALVDDNWSLVGGNAVRNIVIPGGLQPYQTFHTTIELEVLPSYNGIILVNFAEIAYAEDNDGNDLSNFDIDSSPDANNSNDMGGQPGSSFDDFLMGNGTDDEDDHDPAALYTVLVDITDPCECLGNATEAGNGQFSEEITITAPSDQTWFVVQAIGFYDLTSPAPPAPPIPYLTGSANPIAEFPNGDGTSRYVLQGIHIDGEGFTIQFSNLDGYFALFESEGCEYDDSPVDNFGVSSVCVNSEADYAVEAVPGCTYTWTLPDGGGSFVGPNTGNMVTVAWGALIGDYNVVATPSCGAIGCVSPGSLNVSVGAVDGAISCLHNVNISLGQDCETEVTPETILAGNPTTNASYGIMLTDAHGNARPDNYVDLSDIGESLMAKLIDGCSGNSCWANITVEDKLPPVVDCSDIVVPCYAVDTYEPIHYDNCTDATVELLEETVTPLHCEPEYIKEVTRTYQAWDAFGNTSEPCSQLIRVKRLDFDLIELPDDFEVEDESHLICSEVMYDEDGYPSLEQTGVPTIYGEPIYPDFDFYCNAAVEVSTVLVNEDGCVRKYMRTWTIYEAWCTVGVIEEYTQVIEVADFEDPTIVCPEGMEVYTSGNTCSAEIEFEAPTVSDDCSSILDIDINYPGGFINNWTNETITLEPGTHAITYTVYDACLNSASCSINIEVVDATPPVAVCDEFTVVSLNSTGMVKVPAAAFDDGSFDDCYLTTYLARRMDNDSCDCNIPTFSDLTYLGDHNGHYYYLSQEPRSAQAATRLAEAYGGYLAWIDNAEENDWLHAQVNDMMATDYLIGLSDASHEGDFRWPGHNLVNYTNWAPSEPSTIGDYVVHQESNDWAVINEFEDEYYFVVEITDICGWSEYVQFCCSDAGHEHMVGFRVMDKSGFYNNCMVNAEIQDKVSPEVVCPPNQDVECGDFINFDDLTSQFGMATATDACGAEVTYVEEVNIDQCNVGTIEIIFTASDSVNSSTCTQLITISNSDPFGLSDITWPRDTSFTSTCTSTELHPSNLDTLYSYPVLDDDACDFVGRTFTDEVFSFDDSGVACFKILRTWTVIDWCQVDQDPSFEPWTYHQTFKINNFMAPTISTVAPPDTICSFDQDCGDELLDFSFTFGDDCTPASSLQWSYTIDTNSVFFVADSGAGSMLDIMASFPLGEHSVVVNVEDMCGNVADTSFTFVLSNCKNPTAYCVDGLAVALTCMDLDNDGTVDAEMATIYPYMIDAGSEAACDQDFEIYFEGDLDSLVFDCSNKGTEIVTLVVEDENGNTSECHVEVEVQDNDNGCQICKEFDLALFKTYVSPSPITGYDVPHTYQINVINQGLETAYNVSVSDYIPEGYAFIDGVNPGWTIDATGDLATYMVPDSIVPGQTVSFNIVLDFLAVELPDDRTWYNEAEITTFTDIDGMEFSDVDSDPDNDPDNDNDVEIGSDDDNEINGDPGDPEVSDDEDDNDVAGPNFIDLALRKTIAEEQEEPYSYGDIITFNIEVINQGAETVDSYTVTDYLPCGFSFIGPPATWAPSGDNLTTTVTDPIAPGEIDTLTIIVSVVQCTDEGAYRNIAEISTDDGDDIDSTTDDDPDNDPEEDDEVNDPDDEDDHDPEEIEIYDLALIKTIVSEGPFGPGDDVTFEILVINQGNVLASDITVTDYIPDDMTLTIGNTDFFNDLSNPGTAAAFVQNLAAGDTATLSITLTIDDDFMGDSITNWAEISEDDGEDADSDPDADNGEETESPEDDTVNNENDDEDDHDPAVVDVEQIYDLALSKILTTTGMPQPGEDVSFQVIVENQGTLDASNVEITDYIPAGTSLAGGDFVTDPTDASQAVATIGSLPAGATVTLDITLNINLDFAGSSFTNWAEISADDGDDIDSTPNDDNFSEPGETDDLLDDNVVTEDGMDGGDEDDHDPAFVLLCEVAVVATNNGPICEGETVTLMETGGEATSWSWSGPNGFTSMDQNPTVTILDAGDYLYMVTIMDDEGCMNVASTTVTVNPNPEPVPTNDGPICLGEEITVSVTGTPGSTYSWAGPDNFMETGEMFTLTPVETGSFTLTVTETTTDGCTGMAETTLVVDPLPAIDVPDYEVCPDENLTLDELANEAVSWEWSGPNGFFSTLENPTIMAPVPEGTYTLVIEGANGCTDTTMFTISIITEFVLSCDDVQDVTVCFDFTDGADNNIDINTLYSAVDDCGEDVDVEVVVDPLDLLVLCNDLNTPKRTIDVDLMFDGQTLECQSEICIEVKEVPHMCPDQNIILDCNEFLENPDTIATIVDYSAIMCDDFIDVLVDSNGVFDECNLGSIAYEYFVVFNLANDTLHTCNQLVIVEFDDDDLFTDQDFDFPPDITLTDCTSTDPSETGDVVIDGEFEACGPITVFFEDTPIEDGDACVGIERKWTVVDSCQLLNTDPPTGMFMQVQTITIEDETPPMLTCPSDSLLVVEPPNCDLIFDNSVLVEDCTSTTDTLFVTYTDLDGVVSMDTIPGGGGIDTLPGGGVYEYKFVSIDLCENMSMCEWMIEIQGLEPDIKCQKYVLFIEEDMEVEVDADTVNFVLPCDNGDPFEFSFSTDSPDDDILTFDCNDIGVTAIPIYFWQSEMVVDSCFPVWEVRDPNGHCSSPFAGDIYGRILTELGLEVDEVAVELQGSSLPDQMTNVEGYYAFSDMPFGDNYRVIPAKDDNHNNGISTLDLILLQNHILGIEGLDSPYKVIAADVNRSNTVTVLDMLEMRELLLENIESFGNNTSWRLVDADYQFIDNNNPLNESFDESHLVAPFMANTESNFVGVKVGDLNNTVVANLNGDAYQEKRLDQIISLSINDQKLSQGEIIEVPVYYYTEDHVEGFQMGLSFDAALLSVVEIESAQANFTQTNYSVKEDGRVFVSWNDKKGLDLGKGQLFTIKLQANQKVWLSEAISIDEEVMKPEAYINNHVVDFELTMYNDELSSGFILYQNSPNPWSETTTVEFFTPEAKTVQMNIMDVNGKRVYSRVFDSRPGNNVISVDKADINGKGVFYYELVTDDKREVKKMLLMR